MAALTYFKDMQQREFSAMLQVEWVGTARTVLIAYTVEQRFLFEGMPRADAFSQSSVTVSDVGGASYTFTPKTSATDGSSGYAICPQEFVEVQRERMTPHLWRMIVVRRGTKLVRRYMNGTETTIFNAPSWASGGLP